MPKSELKSSASEDENNVTEENEISDDEYLSDFTKLQPYEYKPCVSEESKIKLTRSSDSEIGKYSRVFLW